MYYHEESVTLLTYLILEFRTEECPTPIGAAFIKFDISPSTMLTTPPTLTLTVNQLLYYYYRTCTSQIFSMNTTAL